MLLSLFTFNPYLKETFNAMKAASKLRFCPLLNQDVEPRGERNMIEMSGLHPSRRWRLRHTREQDVPILAYTSKTRPVLSSANCTVDTGE